MALKFIEKKFVKKKHIEQLRREIDIMQKVNHTNVLALKGIHENDTHLTLVMELVDGGELFYKIVDRGSFTEKDARYALPLSFSAPAFPLSFLALL